MEIYLNMNFVDPYTKSRLNKDKNGNLYCENGEKHVVYINNDGIYDFTSHSLEKKAYDHKYRDLDIRIPTLKNLQKTWKDEITPSMPILLNSLGNLFGKKVLLLGNGTSLKELYFLHLGAKVVYTDLSFEAVKSVQHSYSLSELNKNGRTDIEFHAVNALYLPFEDASFDIIYGYAFVHHIDNIELFFSEVYRCLKNGGICRFMDDAYSPIWDFMKMKLLKPLFDLRLKKRFISPEDLRCTIKGGFRNEDVTNLMYQFGFKKVLFIRVSFFVRLFRRGVGLLFNWNPRMLAKANLLVRYLKWIDNIAGRSTLMQNNQIELIWGFDK